MQIEETLFALLRAPFIGVVSQCSCTPDEWMAVYSLAVKQHVEGLAFQGVSLLPSSQRPPLDLIFQWASEVEVVRGQNLLLNRVASKITQMFDAEGRRSAVLKGPANARLYPNKLNRQCGDIDIWLEGGRESVLELLIRMGLLDPQTLDSESKKQDDSKPLDEKVQDKIMDFVEHHVCLSHDIDGISVEVHFVPSRGNFNPFTTKQMQPWLEHEIQTATLAEEGFYVPSIRFALVMQLSHIQNHFKEGIGLKQLVDYYVLLKNSTAEDREIVRQKLRSFGLFHVAQAVMCVLQRIFHLEENLMLCKPDACRGQMLFDKIMEGGHFGFYAAPKTETAFARWWRERLNVIAMMRFDFAEALWSEILYYKMFFSFIPLRIKYRKLWLKKN